MRIAMFLDSSFPPDSRVENEAVSLIEEGHEVFLFSLCNKGLTAEESVNGIKVKRYPLGLIPYKASALAYDVPFYHRFIRRHLRHFIKTVQPQVLHIHDMLLADPLLKIYSGEIPIVLDLHENRPEIMRYYPHLHRFPTNILIDMEKWKRAQSRLMRKTDYLILVTEEAKKTAIKKEVINAEKIKVVPNSIRKDIFLEYPLSEKIVNARKDKFNLVYVGDTGLRRGTDTAIEAVALLRERISHIHLTLVGKSSENAILIRMAKEAGVNNAVSFVGWQDVSLFPSYILSGDVCLSPLHRNPHHDTTFANKIFQYMAMGRAQVVSDCPAQAKVIRNTQSGLVHEADNAEDLAEKIHTLYSDPVLRKTLGENGKEAIENTWHWGETKKGLIDLYHEIALKLNPAKN